MPRSLFAAVLTLHICALAMRAQGQTAPELEELLASTAHTNAHLYSALTQDSALPAPPAQTRASPSDLQAITTTYHDLKKKNELGLTIFKTGRGLTEFVFDQGSKGASGFTPPGLALAAAKELISGSLDVAESKLKEIGRQEVRAHLSIQLERFRESAASEGSLEEVSSLLETGDPVEFRRRLERRVGPILDDVLKSVPPEDRDLVNEFHSHTLAEVIQEGLGTLAESHAALAVDVAQNSRNLRALALTVDRFATEQSQALLDLQERQEVINSGLLDLSKQVGENTQVLDFLQQSLFDNLSPDEQLQALQLGYYARNMPEKERRLLEQEIEITRERQKLVEDVTSVLEAGQHLATIAGGLGLDPKLTAAIQEAVNIGQSGVEVATSLMADNYLAAASSLIGMFGGGRRDVGAERHAQVMKMFKGLYQHMEVVQAKLDALQEGQQKIIENQQKIFAAVQEVHRQVVTHRAESQEQLDRIYQSLLVNRRLLLHSATAGYEACRLLVETDTPGTPFLDTRCGIYPSRQRFESWWRAVSPTYYRACTEQLINTRIGQHVNASFTLEALVGNEPEDAEEIEILLHEVYKPSLGLLQRHAARAGFNTEAAEAALFLPVKTAAGLDAKLATTPDLTALDRLWAPLDRLLAHPLSSSAVNTHAERVANVHFYYLLVPDDQNLAPLTDLAAGKVRTTGKIQLRDALALLDITAAQRNLVSGDVLLPILWDILLTGLREDAGEKEKADVATVLRLLHHNRLAARNLLVWGLRRKLLEGDVAWARYQVASRASRPRFLKEILGLPFDLVTDTRSEWGARWALRLGTVDLRKLSVDPPSESDLVLPLPSAAELISGDLLPAPDLQDLLATRQWVIDELISYELTEGALADEERLTLNRWLANGPRKRCCAAPGGKRLPC
jgi:hypothetical protein